MTTNGSGKLNIGGVEAIKEITAIPATEWTERQRYWLNACLAALAHQPPRWYSYQDWGTGGPVRFLAERGIEFYPRQTIQMRRSYDEGCGCGQEHWRVVTAKADSSAT